MADPMENAEKRVLSKQLWALPVSFSEELYKCTSHYSFIFLINAMTKKDNRVVIGAGLNKTESWIFNETC